MAERTRIFPAALAAALALGAIAAAPAGADGTIGQVVQGVSSPGVCPITGDGFVVPVGVTGNPYDVPPGGGEITQWSSSWGPSGDAVTLAVMRPVTLSLQVVAWDTETFPPPPSNHVATFTPAKPIPVAAGDRIGLYADQDGGVPCDFPAAAGNSLDFLQATLTQGAILTDPFTLVSQVDELPNVDAVVVQNADLALSAPPALASVATGAVVSFGISATSAGASEAATVTDTLTAGLSPIAATVAGVACSLSGQTFTCPLAAEPATISVFALAAGAGASASSATISGSLSDPGTANNSAATSVMVSAAGPAAGSASAAGGSSAPAPATCSLAPLAGLRLALARTLVTDLGCKDGAVKKRSSKKVPKGEVIATTPSGPASLSAGASVSFTVSSGKPATKPVKHKHAGKAKSASAS
jgi:hypothetical protein